jgi:colanic acid/amylovoran biosynthesis protein
MGDLAMLQIALRRLKSLWPDATLFVLAENPAELKFHCPEARPIVWSGCKQWLKVRALPHLLFPDIRPGIRQHFPLSARRLWPLARLSLPANLRRAREFAAAFFNSDLVVVSGCGLLTDAFQFHARRWLDLLDMAGRCGLPTALLGQGLGPIQNPALWEHFAHTVPRAGAIFIRENQASLELLRRAQVPETKIFVTGDDAVELAYAEKRTTSGRQIGVNLRLANYAGVAEKILQTMRAVLAEKSRQYQTTLTGIPILRNGSNSDLQTLERLLAREDIGEDCDTPLKTIRRISDCRLVIAGSYHAGVFALAQGVPVVAILQSAYYRDKFHGLAAQFGCGCVVLAADDAEFPDKLGAAIDAFWAQADELKPRLLAAAERQIQSARSAYAGLPALRRSGA